MSINRVALACLVPAVSVLFAAAGGLIDETAGTSNPSAPVFEVDPFWPKPLPHNWIIGQVAGVAVDSRDHVWIVHRPGSLTIEEAGAAQDPPISECCIPAPPVIEFDTDGELLQAWGGPESHAPWPVGEHGIYVDHESHVWIASSGADDHVVLKFTSDGKRLLQIGEFGKTGGNGDTKLLGGPADIAVDASANEVYISDGYANRRVIVFDSESGEYKRHWGAYGELPGDPELAPYDPAAPPARSFRSPVHAVRLSSDGKVYVADRINNRIQVFRKDGGFVAEGFIRQPTLAMGSTWDIEFSPDSAQTYAYVADGTNNKVWILTRHDLQIVGQFGRSGRYAGQFHWVHSIAANSEGNLYTGEVDTGKRVQKFRMTNDE